MGQLTDSLAEFVADSAQFDVPGDVPEIIATGFCDTVGVTLAGMREPVWAHLSGLALAQGGAAEARLFLGADRVPSQVAALVGAATAHAIDYDDYAFSNHVSAVLVPAILAEAERIGADGNAMVKAYAVGYEVWRAIMKREPGDFYTRGWHPTAVLGGFGAAAAACSLNGADAGTVRNAIGLVVAFGGGVMDNFGSMAKPVQGGQAAESGLKAFRMAEAGVDAGPDALDGNNGLLMALSPQREADIDSPATGLETFGGILGEKLNIKRYPTVGASQRCADAAVQLHTDGGFEVSDIVRIRPKVGERHARVMPMHQPQSALEAKFSLEFVVAAGLINGKLGLAELTDEFVRRDDVQALMKKVETEVGPDDDPEFPSGGRADIVRLDLTDGSVLESREVTRWRGHARHPMSRDELRQKFIDCATLTIREDEAELLFQLFSDVSGLRSVNDIPVVAKT